MSWVAYLGCVVAGATVGFCAAALLAGADGGTDTFCPACNDAGVCVVDRLDHPPRTRWCSTCELGRMYQARASDIDAAWRRLNQTMTEGDN